MARVNPAHIVRRHPDGRRTAASSAPHTRLNHFEIAPPTHQKHSTYRNPSPAFDSDHPVNGNTHDFHDAQS